MLQQDREKVLLLAVYKFALTRVLGEFYFFQYASFGTSTLRNSKFLIGILVVLYCVLKANIPFSINNKRTEQFQNFDDGPVTKIILQIY